MKVDEALDGLGVGEDTLTEEEKERLDRDGYVSLGRLLGDAQVAALRARLDELAGLEGERAGIEVHQEAGTARLADLVNKGEVFDVCWTHPRLLAAVAHVLGPEFKLFALNSRAALPGEGHQALHVDWRGAVEPGDFRVCNSAWLVDPFTERNGPTRVVPGTHLSGRVPDEALGAPEAPHPEEVTLRAPAGTVIVFNSHVWHSGTRNESDEPRRVIHAAFCRRDVRQMTDQRGHLRPETAARVGEAARWVLDV